MRCPLWLLLLFCSFVSSIEVEGKMMTKRDGRNGGAAVNSDARRQQTWPNLTNGTLVIRI